MRTPLQIVADHYEASSRRDIDGMMADLAPGAQWTEMAGFPCAGTYVGRDAIVANVFAALGREWSDFGFTLERLIDGGNTIVALGDYAGTNAHTGRSMRARVAHVWQVADDQVQRFEQFCDTLLVNQAM